tara:strand:+ start:3172 stop:3819 length:648 start_codon:yes stop_codon:yes gene_type:complete
MEIYSIIKQLIEQLSNSPLEEERIAELRPVDFIFDYLHGEEKLIKENKYALLCILTLERNRKTNRLEFNDIQYYKITNEDLFKVYLDFKKNDVNLFIEYFNKEIFKHIQKEINNAKKLEAWDNDNMWYEPNKRFVQWFQVKDIDPHSNILKKDQTNNALWAIADDMRARKDASEFETYMDAYRWAEKNLSKKGIVITAKKLESAYHKAKSEGKIE